MELPERRRTTILSFEGPPATDLIGAPRTTRRRASPIEDCRAGLVLLWQSLRSFLHDYALVDSDSRRVPGLSERQGMIQKYVGPGIRARPIMA